MTVRAFPIGRTTPVQPYVGGGVNFYRWHYKEAGEFIDFSDDSAADLPRIEFEDDGRAVGAVILAGVRVPDRQRASSSAASGAGRMARPISTRS